MGAADEYARQRDMDYLRDAVDDLRKQMRADEQRRADLREADNGRHAAEHDAIEARIERERQEHEADHERESRALATRRDGKWSRGIALAAASAGVASAWVAILVYLHGR